MKKVGKARPALLPGLVQQVPQGHAFEVVEAADGSVCYLGLVVPLPHPHDQARVGVLLEFSSFGGAHHAALEG